MYKMAPESSMWQFWKFLVLLYNDRPKKTFDFINECIDVQVYEFESSGINFTNELQDLWTHSPVLK